MPTAIDFLDGLMPSGGIEAMYAANKALALEARCLLAERLSLELPAPDEMIGSLATLPLPDGPPVEAGTTDSLAQALFAKHRIELPVVHWPKAGRRWFRISAMIYNERAEYERLGEALAEEIAR